VDVTFRPVDHVFTYVRGYTVTLHLTTTVDVKEHEQVTAFLDLVERGGATTPLLERPALRWRRDSSRQ
jgi:hypothetical protein